MRFYAKPRAATSGDAPYSIPDLCKAYSWPTGLSGGGTIGILEMSGGWNAADVELAFSTMGLPAPAIVNVSVDGTQNTPGQDADMEVALDIQVAGAGYAIATGKPANIRIYWAAQSIAAAIAKAAEDGCAVFSMSWGAAEASLGAAYVYETNLAAVYAWQKGMACVAAAGDNDADDGTGATTVDCPACCPQVIACGGTSKPQGAPEVVWNNNPGVASGEGTGGGFSQFFPKPSYQLNTPAAPAGLGRMVPDVAGNADPNTGYQVVLNGGGSIVGGTSAVAPLYAGLIAAVYGRKPGWILPSFYRNPSWFVDITSGNNGRYAATVGPDPCTGLGVPLANKFHR